VATLIVSALLSACSSVYEVTFFADPGKYQYAKCEQLAEQRKSWSDREQELKLLMDRAEQGAGGAIVKALAYKADLVATEEELRLLETAAGAQNCATRANWRSNSAVR
jgi:uncharacterized protein YceK